KASLTNDDLRDGVVTVAELFDGDPLTCLAAFQHGVTGHRQTLFDVIAGVDRREGRRDRDADAAPDLALRGGLARAADAFAVAADDDLEVAVDERVVLEEALAVDDESRVRVAGDVFRLVAETDPGRRHGVGVD